MKKIFLFTAILLLFNICNAQPALKLSAPISDSLKKNVHSVIREETSSFEIKSIEKAIYKIHRVTTVLDATDDDELDFSFYADKFHTLEDFSEVIYNALGEKIKSYAKKDLASINGMGEGLVSDAKTYYMSIPVSAYPVHIEVNTEEKYTGLLFYPPYIIQKIGQSVEKSSFTVSVPAGQDFRYMEKNIKLAPEISSNKENKLYTWSVKNMPALHYEPGSAGGLGRYPCILMAPNKFRIDGYEGDMSSWEKFGEWYGSLTKNSINLSPERKQFFQAMVKDAGTDKEKAALIYKYIQQNCRYVLITLGIGGWKPFEASFVDNKKYGDCKALSNYAQACLDAVGIKSYQALINAEYNNEPVDPSFPHNGFNHDILCIPMANDTVWLECTSNTNEFGVLGSFTENRNALLITENGGKLVPTPKSLAVNNKFTTSCVINLNEDGSGSAKVDLQTTGEYKRHFILTEKKDDQKKYIVNELGFIQPDGFSLTEKDKNSSELLINLDFEKIPSFTAGNKMFLNPRIYKIWSGSLPDASKRTQDFYFPHPFINIDTTTYRLPAGYTIEALPAAQKINFVYGNFNTTYNYNKDKNEVLTITYLELTNHHIQAAGYAKAKMFFDAVLAEYNGKIVIKKLN